MTSHWNPVVPSYSARHLPFLFFSKFINHCPHHLESVFIYFNMLHSYKKVKTQLVKSTFREDIYLKSHAFFLC